MRSSSIRATLLQAAIAQAAIHKGGPETIEILDSSEVGKSEAAAWINSIPTKEEKIIVVDGAGDLGPEVVAALEKHNVTVAGSGRAAMAQFFGMAAALGVPLPDLGPRSKHRTRDLLPTQRTQADLDALAKAQAKRDRKAKRK